MEIYIDNRQEKIEITKDISDIIERVVKECLILEGIPLNSEVSISLVDNEEIRELNRDYRGVDEETDVLSFPLEEDFFMEGPKLLGDIIISIEKALEQGRDYGHSLNREIAYLTAHSMFHLMGYDHMDDESKLIMREKEKQTMKKLEMFKDSRGE